MDKKRCSCVWCSSVNQCAGGMCLGLCESPECSITYPAELLARRVRSRKRERKRGKESERNVKWNHNSSFKVHRNIYALIAKHLSLFPSTLSLCLLCLSSLSPSLSFPVGLWSLSLTYSFPLFTRPEQSNKKWPKHKRTKDKWVGMKTGKAERGERGMRIEKRSKRVFCVKGHPGQARYCKCLPGNNNWNALLISHFTCFQTTRSNVCFLCRNAFIFEHMHDGGNNPLSAFTGVFIYRW